MEVTGLPLTQLEVTGSGHWGSSGKTGDSAMEHCPYFQSQEVETPDILTQLPQGVSVSLSQTSFGRSLGKF